MIQNHIIASVLFQVGLAVSGSPCRRGVFAFWTSLCRTLTVALLPTITAWTIRAHLAIFLFFLFLGELDSELNLPPPISTPILVLSPAHTYLSVLSKLNPVRIMLIIAIEEEQGSDLKLSFGLRVLGSSPRCPGEIPGL